MTKQSRANRGVAARAWMSAALALLVVACASNDNVNPPTQLADIQETLRVANVWSRDTGSGAGKFYLRLQPLVMGQQAYVAGSDGVVSAYSLDKGTPGWRVDTRQKITAGVGGGAGLVAVGTSEGQVIALSSDSGRELWRRALSASVTAIAPVAQGILVVRSGDGYVVGLNAQTGEVVWRFSRQVPALSLRTQSVPIVERGVAFVGMDDGRLAMLSLTDGSVVWERSVALARGRSELERMVDIDGRFVLDGNTLYVATYQGRIAAVDAVNGQILWAQDASSVFGLSVDPDFVHYTDENSVIWALDRRTGATVWKQDALKFRRVGVPAVIGNVVVVGDYEGYLHWLDRASGRFVARSRADKDGVMSDPLPVGSAEVLVLGRGGELSLWQSAGARK